MNWPKQKIGFTEIVEHFVKHILNSNTIKNTLYELKLITEKMHGNVFSATSEPQIVTSVK